VKDGDVAAVRAALESDASQANQKDARFGATPLHWAALRDHEEVARELIAHGADVNAQNRDGETPLRVAERSKKRGVAQLLHQAGSRPSLSALLDAAKKGDADRVEKLATEVPAMINQADPEFGATPLHWAALRGHADVVKVLISYGADLTVTNKDGETPLRVARRANRTQVVELLRWAQSGIP
jgi:ankyrin repeat protein